MLIDVRSGVVVARWIAVALLGGCYSAHRLPAVAEDAATHDAGHIDASAPDVLHHAPDADATDSGHGALDAEVFLDAAMSDAELRADAMVAEAGCIEHGDAGGVSSADAGRGPSTSVALRSGGEMVGEGDLDASVVVHALARNIGEIRLCYQRALQRDPTLAGDLRIDVTIGPDGTTSSVVRQHLRCDDEVADCVISILDQLRFDPAPVGGSVTYPYIFSFRSWR